LFSKKYGSNLPGAIVEIQTTNTDGNFMIRKGSLVSINVVIIPHIHRNLSVCFY